MLRNLYSQFIYEVNKEKSGKASSYIRAIDLLCPILASKSKEFSTYSDVWSITSIEVITALYDYILQEQRLYHKGEGIFVGEEPKSYWRDRYCSAALKSYKEFLVIHSHEQKLWKVVAKTDIPEDINSQLSKVELGNATELISENVDYQSKEGKEALRTVKARVNQSFFRKMILSFYNTQCCITGLNIPEVLRASHIVAWADDKKNRMNPTNGLCLSATYDAAFDRHLISLDDDFRLILSPNLKDHYTNKAFKDTFLRFEGKTMTFPNRFLPDKALLRKHRKKMFA